MQYWNTKSNLLLILGLLLLGKSIHAQENSPYSRYALGNLRDNEPIDNRAMGGVSIADAEPISINPSNPASYGNLKLATYQLGITSHFATVISGNSSNRVGKSTIAYVNLGFPISKRMGVSFGLLPVTSVRYNMQTVDSNIYAESKVTNTFYGGGGTQKIYLGTGYKIDGFSVGLNVGYLFGNMTHASESSFTDSLNILSNNIFGRTVVNGFTWQAGVQYELDIEDGYQIRFGANYNSGSNMRANKETYWESYFNDVGNIVSRPDSSVGVKGKVKLPMQIGVGTMLMHNDNWKIGADFIFSNWKNYTSFGISDSTNNSWTFKLGGAYTPDPESINNTWKRVVYRVGFYRTKDIFSFDGIQISKTGGTIGFGYPLRKTSQLRQIGMFNFCIDFGSRGQSTNTLIKENYTHISFGFTLNDRWFLKRRYD